MVRCNRTHRAADCEIGNSWSTSHCQWSLWFFCGLCVFTARRVCIVRTMPSQHVCLYACPSVCLSVRHTPVFCQNGYTCPQTFSPSGSQTILVFVPNVMLIFWWGSPNGRIECKGVWKNRDFRPISH